jgi:hypothetical protein
VTLDGPFSAAMDGEVLAELPDLVAWLEVDLLLPA